MKTTFSASAGLALSLLIIPATAAVGDVRPDILVADFEGETYGDWKTTGEAFGTGPAAGTLPGQMPVSGFVGKRLVNSFLGGDAATGTLTSPPFTVRRRWLNFLVGGGGHQDKTCINLLVGGKVVRTATGPNIRPGGSEALGQESWDVAEFAGKAAVIEIVDRHQGGWGHILVDQIVMSDTRAAAALVAAEKKLSVTRTHLIVPVANGRKPRLLGIYDGETLVQSFSVGMPDGDEAFWLAAYPLDHFRLTGKEIRVAPVDGAKLPESARAAFDRITIGTAADALKADDYAQPYRDQFHPTTRRGWNNDPNGMVFHGGKYHLYYQYNPFGIGWGNMHWGHLESADLLHWEERPVALFQKTVGDMAFSGGGFVDTDNTAGVGKDTLFVAFTSTGRGECLAYSKDGGLTFTELAENPVVKHRGRDPQILWYAPGRTWVMSVFDESPCAETRAVPEAAGRPDHRNIAFWESKNLRHWTRTGAFTDPDRGAVFECPNLIRLPVEGKPGESRWVLFGAENRFFIGTFDGKTFTKEFGPQPGPRGAVYAAQLFSNLPDGRGVQIGWVRTHPAPGRYPAQIVSQAFTLPQELLLRQTTDGLRVVLQPVKETEKLRGGVLTTGVGAEALNACEGELSEVLIEFDTAGRHDLIINGIDASFTGRAAHVFTDRTFNEVYVDGGVGYFANARAAGDADSTRTAVKSGGLKAVQAYRLRSIWKTN